MLRFADFSVLTPRAAHATRRIAWPLRASFSPLSHHARRSSARCSGLYSRTHLLRVEPLEDRTLLAASILLTTDFPPGGSPLDVAPGGTSPMVVKVINQTGNPSAASDFMAGWQTTLTIVPDGGATGTVTFQSAAEPSNYVFSTISHLGLSTAILGAQDTLLGFDFNFPFTGGVDVPAAGANLLHVDLAASASASGTFGVFAADSPGSEWTDASTPQQLEQSFSNVGPGSGLVRIADVSVPGAVVGADLAITKSDSPDPVVAGNQLTYTLAVTNNGPSVANNVQVTDVLPAGVTFVSTSGCTNDPSGLPTCNLGSIAAGASKQISITVNVNAGTSGTLTNQANVTSSTNDSNPGNNQAITTTTVDPPAPSQADLAISMSDSPDPVIAGNRLTYTMTVTNIGPGDAQGVQVVDTLPQGVTPVSTSGCQNDPGGASTCSLGTIQSGTSKQYTITVDVRSDTPAGTIVNQANVSSSTADPNAANNSVSRSTTINTSADLSTSQTDAPDPVVAGSSLSYTVMVINNGPSDARIVNVADTLPAGVTLESTTGCANGSNAVPTCSLGTIAAGASKQYTISATVSSGTSAGTITNHANVSSSTSDPNTSNNASSQATAVITRADLSVKLGDNPDPVVAGNNLVYTVTVANAGPSDARSVRVSETLASGVTLVSTSGCSGDPSGVPNCDLGNIAAGTSKQYTISVTVGAGRPAGPITNQASVTATTTDPNAANNTDSETTTVQTRADLSITKTDSVDPVQPGDTLTYTVRVMNAGPSDAQGVQVTDTLPAGVTFLSTSGCAEGAGGVPTCSLGSIPAGGTAQYVISVRVDPSTQGSITNRASVAATTTDPDLGNNSAAQATIVQPLPGSPPQVVDVLISGQQWSGGSVPFSLITGIDPHKPLPWINLDRIDVVFNKNVEVASTSMNLIGVNVSRYSHSGFVYNSASLTATWTFNPPLAADKLLLNVAGEAGDASPVDDTPGPGGRLLGDGSDFNIRFDILPGDSNRNGATDVSDIDTNRVGAAAGPPAAALFSPDYDVNGNGIITVTDLVNVGALNGSVLPAGQPQPPVPLRAAAVAAPAEDTVDVDLATEEAVAEIVEAAVQRLSDTGHSAKEVTVLQSVVVEIVDLPDEELARVEDQTVKIDVDAAGFGWFIDSTPDEDVEFDLADTDTQRRASPDSEAHGKMDLLTVVMHELGHVLGYGHSIDPLALMAETLSLGTRRLPDRDMLFSDHAAPDQIVGVHDEHYELIS